MVTAKQNSKIVIQKKKKKKKEKKERNPNITLKIVIKSQEKGTKEEMGVKRATETNPKQLKNVNKEVHINKLS